MDRIVSIDIDTSSVITITCSQWQIVDSVRVNREIYPATQDNMLQKFDNHKYWIESCQSTLMQVRLSRFESIVKYIQLPMIICYTVVIMNRIKSIGIGTSSATKRMCYKIVIMTKILDRIVSIDIDTSSVITITCYKIFTMTNIWLGSSQSSTIFSYPR